MKKKSYALALVLAVVMLLSLLPTIGLAAENYSALGDLNKVGKVVANGSAFAYDSASGSYKTTLSTAAAYDMNNKKTSLSVSATALYTNSSLSSAAKLTTEPKAGTTYYFAIRARMGDRDTGKIYSYDLSSVQINSTVTIDGYNVKQETIKEGDGGAYLQLIYSASLKQATKITGIELSGDGFWYDSSITAYFLDKTALMCKTDAGNLKLPCVYSRLFKDSACTEQLKTVPADGETYYFTVTVKYENGAYENAITGTNSAVVVNGFHAGAVVGTKVNPDRGVIVTCSVKCGDRLLTKLTGIELSGDGIWYDSDLAVYFPDNVDLVCKTDAGNVKLRCSYSRFSKDSACTEQLKTAPAKGETYYFRVTIEYAEGTYQDAITNGNSTVNLKNFTDGQVVGTKVDPKWGVHVICSVKYAGEQTATKKITGIEVRGNGYQLQTASADGDVCGIDGLSAKLTTEGGSVNKLSATYLYTDADCYKLLRTAPKVGTTYYFWVSFSADPALYENAITAANTAVKINGFTNGKVVASGMAGTELRVTISAKYVGTGGETGNPGAPSETTEPTEEGGGKKPGKKPGNKEEGVTVPTAAPTAEQTQPSNAMPWWGLLIIVAMVCGTAIAIVLILKKKNTQ